MFATQDLTRVAHTPAPVAVIQHVADLVSEAECSNSFNALFQLGPHQYVHATSLLGVCLQPVRQLLNAS